MVFVAHTQGRAERTIELLADYEIFAVPIERAEDAHTAVGARRRRPPDARLPPAGRRRCSSGPRPTSSRKSARPTSGAAPRPARSSPTSATSRSATSSSTSTTASACSSASSGSSVGLEPQEFMELRYAGEDKLFVPVERLDLVQKYTGASRPALDRLGGTTWEKAKTRVKKAMRDMAEELLKLYAARKAVAGPRLQPRLALAAGVRGRLRVGPDARSAQRRSPTSSATWSRRRRWTACCAATSATARPKSRCAPRSRR